MAMVVSLLEAGLIVGKGCDAGRLYAATVDSAAACTTSCLRGVCLLPLGLFRDSELWCSLITWLNSIHIPHHASNIHDTCPSLATVDRRHLSQHAQTYTSSRLLNWRSTDSCDGGVVSLSFSCVSAPVRAVSWRPDVIVAFFDPLDWKGGTWFN